MNADTCSYDAVTKLKRESGGDRGTRIPTPSVTAALPDDVEERELVAAIHTRRRRMCIAEGAHHEHETAPAEPGTCPRCGL